MKDIDFLNKQVSEMRAELKAVAIMQMGMRYANREEERTPTLEDKHLNNPEECLRSMLKEIQEMRDEIKSNDAYVIKLENGYDEIEKILFGNAKDRKVEEIVDELRKSNHHAYTLERSRYIEERYIYYPDIKEYVITGSIFENGHIMSKINQKLKTKKRGRKSIKRWDKNGQRYDAIYPIDESEIEMIEEVTTFEIARYFTDKFKTIRRMTETQKVGEYNMPKEVERFSLNFTY
jgi:hypothetical protein